jgi:hypothetical protein
MPDTFAITVIFIIICAVVAAFAKGRSKNKCLMDFSEDLVTMELITGKTILGRLIVENTGLEFMYPSANKDNADKHEMSYILYRSEYPTIQALIRYHDDLDERRKREREKELERTYHPKFVRRFKRKVLNFFKTVRDSVMELVSMVIDQAKKRAPGGALLASQDKYVSQMKQEMVDSIGTAFEPLLERHIGARVLLVLNKGSKKYKYSGVLKDYTAEYIELMDIDYRIDEDSPIRKADIMVPRRYGCIRHLGE